jgi:hypothetical protein
MRAIPKGFSALCCHRLSIPAHWLSGKPDFSLITSHFSLIKLGWAALCLLWTLSALAQQPKPVLPDPKLTPGDVFEVTLKDICTPGYSRKVRAVPRSLRDEAYRLYGITSPNPGDYQFDHLIPLCLGGSNSIRNLWPQSYRTSPWNACERRARAKAL